VGVQATTIAVGLGANVLIADRNIDSLRRVEARFGSRVNTIYSSRHAIEQNIARADLVICAALVPGAKAPVLVTRQMLKTMKPGDFAANRSCCERGRGLCHKRGCCGNLLDEASSTGADLVYLRFYG